MNLLLKLIFREARYHRSRIALAVLATSAMSAMLVWLLGSIDLVVMQYENDGEHYLGHYQLTVIPKAGQTLPPTKFQDDPLVLGVAPAVQIRCTAAKYVDEQSVLRRLRAGHGTPMPNPVIIGIDTKECPFELEEGKWFGSSPQRHQEELEGVIGTGTARLLNVSIGDYAGVRVNEKEFKIKITGTVEQKLGGGFGGPMGGSITPAVGALYVSMQSADLLAGDFNRRENGTPQYYYIRLKDGVNVQKWIEQNKAGQALPLTYISADDIQAMLNKQRQMNPGMLVGAAASQSAIIIFVSLVSVLIVFTALSMGVSERTRTFAMLRTAGMERHHIAALIFGEGLILAVLGWLGGMIAGWLVLNYELLMTDYAHYRIVRLNPAAVIVSGFIAVIGAILAAIIPIYRGTKIQPLEGMNRAFADVNKRWFYGAGFIGFLLLVVNPVCMYYGVSSETSMLRLMLYSCVGLPTQLLGLVLLTPSVILLTEKCFTPFLAKILFVPKALLANQLSANLWRTIGTAVALSIGLGVYSFLEISGYSMLVPFTHSDRLPNTLAAILPKGLPLTEIDRVKELSGIDKDRFLPIALEQPLFVKEQAEQFEKNGMSAMQAQAGIVVFGLDIEEAFENSSPQRHQGKAMLDLQFTEGTLKEALAKLKTGGRYCIVPDSFAFRAGLHIGGKLHLVSGGGLLRQERGRKNAGTSSAGSSKPLEYEVCGVVSIPGWLWMAKLSGIRKYGHRSGAMMFAPYDTVMNDFKINDAAYFWFDRIGKVSDEELENSLQALADEYVSPSRLQRDAARPMVKISSHDYLNERVGSRADQVIQAAARMPLILLAISSFAMMGTIAASIRVRRFEFGVLRSLGITRCGLVRLILAEALLISIAAVVLSVAFGVLGGWCFIGLMKYVSFFGGFTSPLTIPVYYLSISTGVAVILCSIAAVIPAAFAGRKECTELLRTI
ncbi:MAG: ABC transporter permease [Planctomycetaceae bacterium]|jgi:putative ABC transport system permease protein|nr:ABC transporter permease [Planctomycetaceae bacterium]